MTAHVPGAKPKLYNNDILDNKQDHYRKNIPILQIGKDDLDTMKSSSYPDLDDDKARPKAYWKVLFSRSIKVTIGVPGTLPGLVKQQIRWKKSFLRSLPSTGGIFWKRPFYTAMLYYIQTGMKFIRPIILLHAVILLPLSGNILSPVLWLSGLMFTAMIYGVDYRLRHR